MPNNKNYKQDISNTNIYPGQRIQRVLVDEEYVIRNSVGEDGKYKFYYGLDTDREFVELHFYVPDTDNLVYSAVVSLSEGYLKLIPSDNNPDVDFELDIWTTNSNEDSLQEKHLGGLTPGIYDVIINFFADELGTYNENTWRIKRISDSGTEIILHAPPDPESGTVDFDNVLTKDYEQFLLDSVFFGDFKDNLQNVFSDLERDRIIAEVYSVLTDEQRQQLQVYEDSTTTDNAFLKLVNEILLHVYYDTVRWTNGEISTDLPGGPRYRIQKNRLFSHLSSVLSTTVSNHTVDIIANDSGEIPFIIDS